MAKSKHTPAPKGFHENVQAALSDRLERMQTRFVGVQEGAVSFTKPGEIAGIVSEVQTMVEQARALEERTVADAPIENVGAVQAANLLYQVRDKLRDFDRALAERQRVLIEKHREPNVDPDGTLQRGFETLIGELQQVRQLVVSGSEVRS